MKQPPELVLAPIRGITDCHFRTLFHKHFPGFDSAIAPFINPQRHANFRPRQLKDMLPKANQQMSVIPQLLHTDAEDFLFLASRLADLGYTEINWNLGCPAPMVTRKKRGSGLLPYPDEVISFLDTVLPKLPVKLSIKTRLGLKQKEELLTLLPKLDNYPLTEIIIHARLGSQLYRGVSDRDAFSECLRHSSHRIVYNGDIVCVEDFQNLAARFPKIKKWMIGRGALADPFLPGTIKGIQQTDKRQQLQKFHEELYSSCREILSGQSHILGRMKQIWMYLSAVFPPEMKAWKKIKKCRTEEKYQRVVAALFEDYSEKSSI